MNQQLSFGRRPNTARFSPCELYRYTLTRELGGDRPLVICGLNPSTATADVNDPTIRREIGFAERWQYGRLFKVNAYAWRATDPDDMKRERRAGVDVIGPENDAAIRDAAELAKMCGGIFIAAWGRNIEREREFDIARILISVGIPVWCFGTDRKTGAAYPEHPLYVGYTRELREWQYTTG